MEVVSEQRCFDGTQGFYRHASKACDGPMNFAVYSPPTVAGWAGGRSWITPGLLLERGNFARDVLFPDINFIAPDRVAASEEVRRVADRIRQGMDITTATMPDTKSGEMAESNQA